MPADVRRRKRRRFFLVASGRWQAVYAFLVQFHQRSLWAAPLVLAIPVLLLVLLRAWGVEEMPYEEEAPEVGSGRLGRAARRVFQSQRNVYQQALLIDEISEMASHVVAINEGIEVSGARRLCRSGDWTRDPIIASLIRDRELPGSPDEPFVERFERVLNKVERALKGGAV
jgi:hypothetical protein